MVYIYIRELIRRVSLLCIIKIFICNISLFWTLIFLLKKYYFVARMSFVFLKILTSKE